MHIYKYKADMHILYKANMHIFAIVSFAITPIKGKISGNE